MSVTVRDFFEAGQESLELQIDSGEKYFDRKIHDLALNRPGLALAGFYTHFPQQRVQVLGLAELAYLKSLSSAERAVQLDQICKKHVPTLVITRSRHPLPEIHAAATKHKIPVLRSGMITSRFINQSTLILETLAAPRMRVQGTLVDIMGIGVLIEGKPGIGKSETALTIVERGHSLVADDITLLHRDNYQNHIMGTAVGVTRYHMEIRGLGIVHIPSLFGVAAMRKEARLDLIISLHHLDPNREEDRTGLNPETRDVMGVQIPAISLPVAPGRDMAHVIEVAALNQKLKHLGHDAAKELDDKLVRILTSRESA